MYCKHCGKPIDDNSQFCKFCGKKLVNSQKIVVEFSKPFFLDKMVAFGKKIYTRYIIVFFNWIIHIFRKLFDLRINIVLVFGAIISIVFWSCVAGLFSIPITIEIFGEDSILVYVCPIVVGSITALILAIKYLKDLKE